MCVGGVRRLAVSEASLMNEHTQHLLARVCKSLFVLDNLSLQHLQAVTTVSRVTHLSMVTEGQNAAEMLVSLTCLVELRHLETSGFTCLPTDLSRLSGLNGLRIGPSGIEPQDLSDLTQLKSPFIEPFCGRNRIPVYQSKGPNVSLQYLFSGSDCRMYNLEAATHLSHLEFLDVSVNGALQPNDPQPWPQGLLQLQKLRVHSTGKKLSLRGASTVELPVAWQFHTSLQQLTIPFFEPWHTGTVPSWFTALKQLTRLELPGAAVLDLNHCFPYISQLCHSDLSCYASNIDHRIFLFSHMPNLTYLSFADLGVDKWNGTSVHDRSGYECDCLDSLTIMLSQSQKQPAKLFRINASDFSYAWRSRVKVKLHLRML